MKKIRLTQRRQFLDGIFVSQMGAVEYIETLLQFNANPNPDVQNILTELKRGRFQVIPAQVANRQAPDTRKS